MEEEPQEVTHYIIRENLPNGQEVMHYYAPGVGAISYCNLEIYREMGLPVLAPVSFIKDKTHLERLDQLKDMGNARVVHSNTHHEGALILLLQEFGEVKKKLDDFMGMTRVTATD